MVLVIVSECVTTLVPRVAKGLAQEVVIRLASMIARELVVIHHVAEVVMGRVRVQVVVPVKSQIVMVVPAHVLPVQVAVREIVKENVLPVREGALPVKIHVRVAVRVAVKPVVRVVAPLAPAVVQVAVLPVRDLVVIAAIIPVQTLVLPPAQEHAQEHVWGVITLVWVHVRDVA